MIARLATLTLFIALLFSCTEKAKHTANASQESSSVTVTNITRKCPYNQELYTFPNVDVKLFPTASERINNYLRLNVLRADSLTPENEIFDKVWGNPTSIASLSQLSYAVEEAKYPVFSIRISGQYCGAYCQTGSAYFVFDTRNGKHITVNEVLNSSGIHMLVDSLNDYRKNQLAKRIELVQDTLNRNATTQDFNKNVYEEMLNIYSGCLEDKLLADHARDLKFLLIDNHLVIELDRCSARGNRAIDELANLSYSIDLKKWEYQLTDYGKSILN
ncbi:MAG: hypothetical protein V4616_07455 [Bacteroidota bacterium]